MSNNDVVDLIEKDVVSKSVIKARTASSISEVITPDTWKPFPPIGLQIKTYREEKGLSRVKLAKKARLNEDKITSIELYYVAATLVEVRKIEKALGKNLLYDERKSYIA